MLHQLSTQSTIFQEKIHMQLHGKLWIVTAVIADIMHVSPIPQHSFDRNVSRIF